VLGSAHVQAAPLDVRGDDRSAAWWSRLGAGAAAGRHAAVVVSTAAMRSQLHS